MDEQQKYLEIGRAIGNAEESQFFGKPCFKTDGKAFIAFFENSMVFKLAGDEHKEAFSLDGSELFDPSKKHRPMKEWVRVPADYSDRWKDFAQAALTYVRSLNK